MDFSKQNTVIFTDGACSGNPGPGGWGSVLALPEGEIIELGGSKDSTTNNEMELTAVIRALHFFKDFQNSKNRSEEIHIYTDSTYVIRGITLWVWAWLKRGWKTAEGEDVANQELWKSLLSITQALKATNKIHWLYSRGHVGTPGNERCDEIAVGFSKKKWVDLYRGPLINYSIAIYDLPEETELPAMKPKTEKKVAYSYLSKVSGVVERHSDWSSCERRVKGKSGALFKKALSLEEEQEILASWGFSPDHFSK